MTSEGSESLPALAGGARVHTDQLFELTYNDLRKLAGSHLDGDTWNETLQPTEIVHEVYMKLVGSGDADWRSRSHFFAVSAVAMRQILVDYARRTAATKRGGDCVRISLDERLAVSMKRDDDVLILDDALQRLAQIDGNRARIVEMRFFAGMTLKEIASVLGVSYNTVKRQWASTSSWLRAELHESSEQ